MIAPANNDQLKNVCVTLLRAAEVRLCDLVQASGDQADREAAEDALGKTRAAVGILTQWYGCEPEGEA